MFEEPEMVPYVPGFIEEKGEVTGTVRGNAYHRVMELLDFSKAENEKAVWESLEQKAEEQRIGTWELTLVKREKLNLYLSSEIAKRMKKASEEGKLYREQPFVLGISAKRVDKKFPENETLLIQGIIDAYFEEDGEIVVLDYKTDSVKKKEELIKRYKEQLNYYEEALEKLTGRKVKEKILYSFALNETIVVE